MSGLETIPIRWPDEYDPAFMEMIFREVLAKADVRNAEGFGVTISGTADEVATISGAGTSESFIVVAANDDLDTERVLAVEAATLTLTDNGPNLTVVIAVKANGISFNKIQEIAADTILGRVAAGTGNAGALTATQIKSILELLPTSDVTFRDIASDGTTDSSSTTTGAIQTDGGAGIVKNLHVGAETFLNLPTAATGASGSLWADAGTVKVVP